MVLAEKMPVPKPEQGPGAGPLRKKKTPELKVLKGGLSEKPETEIKTETQKLTDDLRKKIEAGEKMAFNSSNPEFVKLKNSMLHLEARKEIDQLRSELQELNKEVDKYDQAEHYGLPSGQMNFEDKMRALEVEYQIDKKVERLTELVMEEDRVIEEAEKNEDILEYAALPSSGLSFEEKMRAIELQGKIKQKREALEKVHQVKTETDVNTQMADAGMEIEMLKEAKQEKAKQREKLLGELKKIQNSIQETERKADKIREKLAKRRWGLTSLFRRSATEEKIDLLDLDIDHQKKEAGKVATQIKKIEDWLFL